MKTHIDVVIKIITEIGTFDLNCDLFKEFLTTNFFEKYTIAEENVQALLKLLGSTSDKKYQINKNNGKEYIEIINISDEASNSDYVDLPDINDANLTSFEKQGAIIKQIVIEKDLDINRNDYPAIYQKFIDEINEAQGHQKQEVIKYLSENLKETDIKAIEEIFWENSILSLLKAEYIIIDDYSQKLKNTIAILEEFYGNFGKTINITSFYLIKAFVRTSWYIIDYCFRDKKMIENELKEIILVATDRRMRFLGNQYFNRIEFTIGEKQSRSYEKLMELIIEMTAIDHLYIVSNENVEKLIQLWGRVSNCGLNENIIEIVKLKTSVLLYVLLKKLRQNKDCITNIDKLIIKDYISYYNLFKKQCGYSKKDTDDECKAKNPFVILRSKYENNRIDYESFAQYQYETDLSDVKSYDKFTLKGIKDYCNNSDYFVKCENKQLEITDIEQILDKYKIISSQMLIVNFITYLYKKVEEEIPECKEDIDKKLEVLNRLERMLAEYIAIHKTNKIPSFRPTFLYSFYTVTKYESTTKIIFQTITPDQIENYDCRNIPDNTFFFSSADLSPVRMVWLEKQLSEYKTKIQQLNFNYDHLLNKEMETKISDVAKKEENLTNAMKKVKVMKVQVNKIRKEIDNTQKNNITVLGILTGMIMFVTASVKFFENNSATLFDYLKFALILVGSLSFFAVTIKVVFEPDDNQDIKKWVSGIWKVFIIIALIILSFILLNCLIKSLICDFLIAKLASAISLIIKSILLK
jgi:hypothetical protein